MAVLVYELEETYMSISRVVTNDIMKQLIDKLNIQNKDIPIYYPGPNGKSTTWNSNNIKNESTPTVFSSRERISITVEEDFMEEDMLTMSPKHKQHPPIFHDKQLGISIEPIYTRVKASVNINYKAVDRYAADSFINHWRRKIAENREYMTFRTAYTYPIPRGITGSFILLYNARQVNKPEYNNWYEYLKAYGDPAFTTLTNTAGNGEVLAFREEQCSILGNMTDEVPAKKEKDDEGSTWTVSFTFEYFYDKVIANSIKYPIIVNNELVDELLYPDVTFDIADLKYTGLVTSDYYNKINQLLTIYGDKRNPLIKIPNFDDWSDPNPRYCTRALLSALVIVDKEIPRDICNLTNMGEWGLHELLIPVFQRHYKRLNKYREFPFQVCLFEGNNETRDDVVQIDRDLNISSKFDLSLFKQQRLVIRLITNLSILTDEARNIFFSEPILVNAWLDLILGKKPINGYPRIIGKKANDNFHTPMDIAKIEDGLRVDINDFMRVCKENKIETGWGTTSTGEPIFNPGCLFATVGIFTITGDNIEDYVNGNCNTI